LTGWKAIKGGDSLGWSSQLNWVNYSHLHGLLQSILIDDEDGCFGGKEDHLHNALNLNEC